MTNAEKQAAWRQRHREKALKQQRERMRKLRAKRKQLARKPQKC